MTPSAFPAHIIGRDIYIVRCIHSYHRFVNTGGTEGDNLSSIDPRNGSIYWIIVSADALICFQTD